MPIVYNKELDGWEAKDLTEEEKDELMDIACMFIASQFGMDLANKMMDRYAPKKVDLADIDSEDMGRA